LHRTIHKLETQFSVYETAFTLLFQSHPETTVATFISIPTVGMAHGDGFHLLVPDRL